MNEKIMYTIGKIAAVIEQHGELPPTIFDKLVTRPVHTLGLLKNRDEWRAAMVQDGEELGMLFAKLPADIADPADGVKIETQGPFWIGYYHRKHASDIAGQLTSDLLAESGKLLFGEHWQAPMVEALGLSDTARIRQWLSGNSKIPIGIWSEIDQMLRQKHGRIGALLDSREQNNSL